MINNIKSYQSNFFIWTNLRKGHTSSVPVMFQNNWIGGSREEDFYKKPPIINKWSVTSKVIDQFFSFEQIWQRVTSALHMWSFKATRPVVSEKKIFKEILKKNHKKYKNCWIITIWTILAKTLPRSIRKKFLVIWCNGFGEKDV